MRLLISEVRCEVVEAGLVVEMAVERLAEPRQANLALEAWEEG